MAAFHESGMQLWDFDRRELIRRVDGYDVWKGHMSSGGGVVAFNLAGGLSILDASSGAIQSPFTYPTGFRGRAVGLSPSGGVAAVGGESAVWIIDLRTGNAIELGFGGLCVAFSPDGTKLIACDGTGNVRMVEVQTGVSLAHHGVDRPIAGCAWLPSGDRVALVTSAPAWNPKRGRVLVLSAPALRPVITLRDEWANGQALAVSRDGKLIAVTSGRWLVVMDDRGVEVSRARGSQSRLYSVGFAADDYAVGVGYDEDSLAGIVAHKIPGG